MQDMLVKLYNLPSSHASVEECRNQGIVIRRAMAPDKLKIVDWVKEYSSPYAAGECDVCFSNKPISCYIATQGNKIIGYACYNATAPDFFGPTRVLEEYRGKGVGKALLVKSLESMREEGYGYAIIGGVGPKSFYEKCVGAILIPDSTPGIYENFLGLDEEE